MDIDHCWNKTSACTTELLWATAKNNTHAQQHMTTFLRPDDGGVLLPWLYTVIVLVIHIPTVLVRVLKWQRTQALCLAFTTFTVIVYIQAFVSTKFDPSKILMWNPIILIVDAGSMLQLFFLIIEAERRTVEVHLTTRGQGRPVIAPQAETEDNTLLDWYMVWRGHRKDHTRVTRSPRTERQPCGEEKLMQYETLNRNLERPPHMTAVSKPPPLQWTNDSRIWVALFSLILFVLVLVLQLIGLVHAFGAYNAKQAPEVWWCTTLLQPSGIATIDDQCRITCVGTDDNRGIGCILMPGIWQQDWLKATIVILIAEFVLIIMDIFILYYVSKDSKCLGIQLKRPWFSIMSGIASLLATLILGVRYANSLPPNFSNHVTVLSHIEHPTLLDVRLHSAGLRGNIIGWNDGLFDSWKGPYFGR